MVGPHPPLLFMHMILNTLIFEYDVHSSACRSRQLAVVQEFMAVITRL